MFPCLEPKRLVSIAQLKHRMLARNDNDRYPRVINRRDISLKDRIFAECMFTEPGNIQPAAFAVEDSSRRRPDQGSSYLPCQAQHKWVERTFP
jgi:hypothetical protein